MIVPNLMVSDISLSVAFYTDVLGMSVIALVDLEGQRMQEAVDETVSFATLEWQGGQLMLQRRDSLTEILPELGKTEPGLSGTVYLRGFSPDDIISRLPSEQILRGPVQQWYGMKELYFRDPDGYILCAGRAEGEAPS